MKKMFSVISNRWEAGQGPVRIKEKPKKTWQRKVKWEKHRTSARKISSGESTWQQRKVKWERHRTSARMISSKRRTWSA